jgi:hypothetical protein
MLHPPFFPRESVCVRNCFSIFNSYAEDSLSFDHLIIFIKILQIYESKKSIYDTVTCMCVTRDGIWIGEATYWPLTGRTKNNYNTIAISTIYRALLLQSLLSVSWQRILTQEL